MHEKVNNAFRDEGLLGFLMQGNTEIEKEYYSRKRGKWEPNFSLFIIFKEVYL